MKTDYTRSLTSLSLGLIAFFCTAYIAAMHAENNTHYSNSTDPDSDDAWQFDTKPLPENPQQIPGPHKTVV